MTARHAVRRLAVLLAFVAGLAAPLAAGAADREVIDARVKLALEELYREMPGARELAADAKGLLVMPKVVKGGFIVGGAYGEGALRVNMPGRGYAGNAEYYSVAAASIGFQAGLQETSHVLFFLTDRALEKFRASSGWEVGADAEITLLEAGANVGVDSTSFENPVVAVVFGEDGLLIGASLEGAKYSRIVR
jgi:lipid-binding SYLF domain-containing protein